MNDNYVMYNGKKLPFPKEWEEMLKEEEKKDIFAREDQYYFIHDSGDVTHITDFGDGRAINRYKNANYCTDRLTMKQRALHEILDRRLWRFSKQHGMDEINWSNENNEAFVIYYDYISKQYAVGKAYWCRSVTEIYLHTREIAERAIKEIIEPFMEEHPEFKW